MRGGGLGVIGRVEGGEERGSDRVGWGGRETGEWSPGMGKGEEEATLMIS